MTGGRSATWGRAALAVAALVLPIVILGENYRLGVLTVAAIYGIALVGLDLVVGFGGQLSLATPAFMAIGAYSTAWVTTRFGLPIAGLVAGLALTLVVSVVVGRLTLRVAGLALTLVTFFFVLIVREGLAQVDVLGGSFGISNIPPLALGPFTANTRISIAVVVAAVLGLALLAAVRMIGSAAGREVLAMSGDPVAAAAFGIDVPRRKVELFVASAVFASVAGFLYAHARFYVSPEQFDFLLLFDLLLMLFLGGLRTYWGGVIGAVIVGFLPELGEQVADFQLLLRGAIFLLLLALVGDLGIVGAARRGFAALRRGSRAGPAGRPAATAPPAAVISAPADVPDQTVPSLAATGLSKRFGGVHAVRDVDLTVPATGITAVVGPNGAGKTTLFNLLAGAMPPDDGSVELFGDPAVRLGSAEIARRGVGRTFQHVRLADRLTVLDNVAVGTGVANRSSLFAPGDRGRLARARELARAALDTVGIGHLADRSPTELPLGEQRMAELARALAHQPRLLLLDEPASGLSDEQRARLGDILLRLRDRVAILLIEHDVEFVRRVASHTAVMAQGQKIFDGPTSDAFADRRVVEAYLGPSRAGVRAPERESSA